MRRNRGVHCQRGAHLGRWGSERVDALVPVGPQAPTIDVGDELVLAFTPEAPAGQQYQFFDYDRSTTLLVLVAVFVLAVLALTRWRGLPPSSRSGSPYWSSSGSCCPRCSKGGPPLLIAVVGAERDHDRRRSTSRTAPTTRTSVALLGTLLSLALTGALGALFTGVTKFTGQADESNVFLNVLVADLDVRGLLLAGLVIGALGVLDDVTVTQAAAVWELADAQPTASPAPSVLGRDADRPVPCPGDRQHARPGVRRRQPASCC